jgi:glycolate oxidase
VTRHNVLGLEAVLGTGEVIRTGGKFVKSTTGYDLTQLIIGSEGTLAIVTEATLRLVPRPAHATTLLVPFRSLDDVAAAVPAIIGSGVGPLILEYIDMLSMGGIVANAGIELGVPDEIKQQALIYLVVVIDGRSAERVEQDMAEVADLLTGFGALDLYALPAHAGAALIDAREKAFWAAKASGANDILDMVVPRSEIPVFLSKVGALSEETGSLVVGCGHVGDGNVHFSVFQPDDDRRHQLVHDILAEGVAVGGRVSGEHGIGTEKKAYFLEFEDEATLALMRRIKVAFDPNGILNPGTLF